MNYWSFFPAEEPWARMPVWGFADVVASEAEGVPEGTRIFGYLPRLPPGRPAGPLRPAGFRR